jgi:hypothetical protein
VLSEWSPNGTPLTKGRLLALSAILVKSKMVKFMS